jgi:Holliday junction DNA helicase RuvA
MIGALEGKLTHKAPPHLLLDVGGVSYEVEAPMSTFYNLPPVGERLRLLTHLVVREDAHILYGFGSSDERALFRNLIKVTGVGPRIALAILSGVSVNAFAQCVRMQDSAALTRIPGVGRKIAERLVIEMRDRLAAMAGQAVFGDSSLIAAGTNGTDVTDDAAVEAWNALVALGYKPAEATRLLKGVASGSTEDRIRRALQGAAP